ncbi:hypothetical protein ACFL5Q_08225, partial [Planctomycetota bacterium]
MADSPGPDIGFAFSPVPPGHREHGAWFEKQVYLFSGETTFQKFNADPYRYVSALQRNEQPNPNT